MKTLLKNAVILDARHENARKDVLVEGERIVDVSENIEENKDINVLDLDGCTLLPGFIDAHVHVAVDDAGFSDNAIKAWAFNGVTTVRELGMLSTLSAESFMEWLKEHDSPDFTRVIKAGKYIDIENGYGSGPMPNHNVGIMIETPEEAADAVSYQYGNGSDGIKIGISDGGMHGERPRMTPEMISAICARAKSHGMWIAAHLGKTETLKMLMDCGITEAAHTPDDEMPDSLIAEMVEKGIAMDTTIGDPNAPPPDPNRLPPGMGPIDLEEMMKSMKERRKGILKNLKKFHEAGGMIVMGTDLIHSDDFMRDAKIPVHELVQLRQIGMPFMDVIRCGTINGAKVCGIEKEEGTVEAGKRANLIAVKGEVDDRFEALNYPGFVMNRGKILKNVF